MYTVYKLEEELSPIGKPYIRITGRFEERAIEHKRRLKLSYVPTLIPIKDFLTKKEARKFENQLREQNGWEREGAVAGRASKGGKVGGKIGGSIVGKYLWINKDEINKRVKPEDLYIWINNGYVKGMIKKRPRSKNFRA